VGVPTGLLASDAFNTHPMRLTINGVRETNGPLFEMLATSTSAHEAAGAFESYMRAVFGLEDEQRDPNERRFRSSYLRLLQGWGFDANGSEGAVLKGWVESRFGILPTFHKEPLGRFPSEPWMTYLEEKMSGRFHNNSIHAQLDLLYEYGQWMLSHWFSQARRHVRLFRGVNDFSEHRVVERIGKREVIARQNNLVSFTASRDTADQFGDTILEAEVPVVKILFFNDLLTRHTLRGEGEYLVIGGEYRVKFSYL
jgi:NAD+--dinitrogen-reductase ADP-D-ribosyltransferase